MICSGAIIPHRHARPLADENRPGALNVVRQPFRFRAHQLQMLRRESVRRGRAFAQVRHNHQRPPFAQRRARNFRPLRAGKQFIQLRMHRVRKVGVRRRQNALRHFVVLRLRQYVGGGARRVGGFVRDDEDLGGSGQRVESGCSAKLALGFGHIGAAGSDDFVGLRNGFGSESEGRHRVGAADAKHPVGAGDACGGQRDGAGVRGGNNHFGNAGDFRRNGAHQDGRRISGASAGGVDGGAGQRADFFAEDISAVVGEFAGFGLLFLVAEADSFGGEFQRLAQAGVDFIFGVCDVGGADFEFGGGFGREVVVFAGAFQQGVVAAGLYFFNDVGDALADGVHCGGRFAQFLDFGGEVRPGGIQAGDFKHRERRVGVGGGGGVGGLGRVVVGIARVGGGIVWRRRG